MDTPLAGWENFYVIVGSSAGGLTGLTFVVIALAQDTQRVQPAGLKVFVTPTIVHFGAALALAAFLTMPHQGVASVSAGLALGGLSGLIYSGVVAVRMPGVVGEYVPVREDWICNVILPILAYGYLLAAAALMWERPGPVLYGVATVSLLLLFVGIHNAWDIAVWMAVNRRQAS